MIEPGFVDFLDRAGVGARLHSEGLVHDGVEISFGGRRQRIDFRALTSKAVTVYGQTEITRDLMDARTVAGAPTIYEADRVSLRAPRVRCRKNGVEAEIECDFIAGCDGFHGVSRQTIPEAAIRTYERVYPFGWLGILCETLPVSRELIYVNHDRGFALCSMRSQGRSRLYIQCRLDDSIEGLARRAVLGGAEASSRSQGGHNHRDPAVDREEHRTAAQLCLRADAVRAAVPSGRRRPHRAAARRQGLNLAASDVYYLWQAFADFYDTKSTAGLDAYSDRALARVWQAERFSWWMTMLLHRFPERSGFDQKVQRVELEYLARSQTVQASLAENYVGLPY